MRVFGTAIALLLTVHLSAACGSKDECERNADCEDGVCVDGECVPLQVGAACDGDGDCADDLYCADNLPGGYCTSICDSDEDCPPGAVCLVQGGEGICLAPCDDDDDCRDEYVCTAGVCFLPCESDAECDGGYVCLDGRCTGSGVGAPCSEDDDCEEGLECAHEEHGGYCTTECGDEGKCPVGGVCGSMFGRETCLASCRADEDCGRDGICHQGGCIIRCGDGDCPEAWYCTEAGFCREEGEAETTTMDLGSASAGTRLELEVPPGTHSITLVVHGLESSTFEFSSLVDPEGTERITGKIDMGMMGEALTEPHRTMPRHEINTTQIPNSDYPGMEVIPGTWSFTFTGGTAQVSAILKQGGEEGGSVPLNVFVAPDAFPGSPDASNLANDSHFHAVLAEWDHFFVEQANVSLGEIRYFDLPPEYTDLEIDMLGGDMEFEEMFKRFSRDDGLNAFFIRSLSSLMGPIAGVSGGIPGPPRTGETVHSGIVAAVQDEPRYTGLTFCHEAGHFHGLFHTSEQTFFGGPQVHDMLSDTPQCDPSNDPCTESKRHLMFPMLEPTMEILSPASAMVVRANAGVD